MNGVDDVFVERRGGSRGSRTAYSRETRPSFTRWDGLWDVSELAFLWRVVAVDRDHCEVGMVMVGTEMGEGLKAQARGDSHVR